MQKNPSLKDTASKGILWSALEKFLTRASQFVITIILGRLLFPEDYGVIGMIAIFIGISEMFIESGMGTALIQRQNRTEKDYSTVFFFNLGVSVFFYILLYISAPYIADFYNTPKLTLITRVVGINVIINAFGLIQRTRLTIELNFKTLAKVNVISMLVAGICAVYFAYVGYGLWALVLQRFMYAIICVLLLWFFSRWNPLFVFSKESFKSLFGFSSRLLAAGVYATTFQNIYNVIIGKVYSASALGFYAQAKTLTDVSAGTITHIINQVTFPLLASLQEDKSRMVMVNRRVLKMTAFIITPILFFIAVIAQPLILLTLGEKWSDTIPLLQWMCFAKILSPLSGLNLNFLNANGRSDLFLKVDLLKAPMIIFTLVITIPISVKAVVIGQVVCATISYFFNTYYSGKLYNFGAFKQLKDISLIITATILASVITFVALSFIEGHILKLIIGGFSMFVSYCTVSYFFKIEELIEVKQRVKGILKK
jgi:teichuronic acid exporter